MVVEVAICVLGIALFLGSLIPEEDEHKLIPDDLGLVALLPALLIVLVELIKNPRTVLWFLY